jgi:hypothetical protein
VQEVEEVREAHKAAASAQMAGIVEMAQSTEIGTLALRRRTGTKKTRGTKKYGTCSQVRTRDHVDVTMLHNHPPHDGKVLECSVLVTNAMAVVELIKPVIQ